MKYVMMFIAIAIAFIAVTQTSNANSLTLNTVITQSSESSLMSSMGAEWLVPDNAHRMMAYHKALNA